MGAFYQKLSFNVTRDIAPVAGIGREPNLVAVNPAVPATTVPEFIAYVKANPGKLSLGVGGIGTTGHVAGELFRMMTGIDLVIVPYRGGGPALTDLLAGVGARLHRPGVRIDRSHPGRQIACFGCDHGHAISIATGHPGNGRISPGLRGEHVLRHWGSQARLPKSSTSSTRRSMPGLPIPG